MESLVNPIKILAVGLLGLSLAGCGDSWGQRAVTGAGIGAGTGAVIGAIAGGPVIGAAVVGSLIGAGVGAATTHGRWFP